MNDLIVREKTAQWQNEGAGARQRLFTDSGAGVAFSIESLNGTYTGGGTVLATPGHVLPLP